MIEQFAPAFPIIAVVSDSYDLGHAVRALWGRELKPVVDASGSRLVVRPDSGDPTEACMRRSRPSWRPTARQPNGKGFRVLPDHVRVIQDDGVEEASIRPPGHSMRMPGDCRPVTATKPLF